LLFLRLFGPAYLLLGFASVYGVVFLECTFWHGKFPGACSELRDFQFHYVIKIF
jgi:hypothetical protein